MKLLHITYALALVASGLVSCTADVDTDADRGDVAFRHLQSKESCTLTGSASAFASDTDLTFGTEIDMLLPVKAMGKDVSSLRDSILSLAFDTVGTDYSRLMSVYQEHKVAEVGFAYTPIENDNDSVEAFLPNLDGYACVHGNVANMTPEIISYQLVMSEYPLRAAHGDYTIRYLNYDFNTARVFGLSDIFTAEGLQALPAILKERARTVQSVIGPTSLTDLPSADNFFINNKGDIVFAYQPYEIASYAQGAVQVKVQPYRVSQYLTDYGKQLLLY